MPALYLLPAESRHRTLLRRLYELYAHDFSPMTGAEIGGEGWWTEADFLAGWPEAGPDIYLFQADGNWAGFAWVGLGSYATPGLAQHTLMEEFFMLRKYRRHGLGEHFARQLFDRYPGEWEIGELAANVSAQAFWRRVIGRYTGDRFREAVVNNEFWTGPVQIFQAGAQRDA